MDTAPMHRPRHCDAHGSTADWSVTVAVRDCEAASSVPGGESACAARGASASAVGDAAERMGYGAAQHAHAARSLLDVSPPRTEAAPLGDVPHRAPATRHQLPPPRTPRAERSPRVATVKEAAAQHPAGRLA